MNRCLAAAAFFSLTIAAVPGADDKPVAMSANELAGRMNAARLGSALMRVRLETQSPDAGKSVFQLQIKERRTRAGSDLVYEVLWPKQRKGEAVILHQDGNGAPSGSIVTPPNTARPLKGSDMDNGLFGSDLTYQDAIENFFAWGEQTITGSEVVDNVPCLILESKPGRSGITFYGKVRSWIDPRRFVPMRVEKYSTSGQLLRRIETTRVSRDEGRRLIPSRLIVSGSRKGSVTELNGARIDQDVKFTDQDFTPAGLGK